MRNTIIFLYFFLASVSIMAQTSNHHLVIRLDDIGMLHSVNMGAEKIFKTGMPVNASLMACCSWFDEAVSIVKKYPNVAVGVHLTLNSEWNDYNWRPLSGYQNVPSLVTKEGYFRPNNAWYWKDSIDLKEMEMEFRLQIETVLKTGLKVSYIDSHMACWRQKDATFEVVEKLAREYNLGLSMYFSEKRYGVKETNLFESLNDLIQLTDEFAKNEIILLVFHPGVDSEEMQVLTLDGKSGAYANISSGRDAAVKAVSSENFIETLMKKDITIINYAGLIKLKGLNNPIRPKI